MTPQQATHAGFTFGTGYASLVGGERSSSQRHAGLTSAMYLRDGREAPSPDPAAGLYIRTRRHGVVQVAIPADQLAYQMGEALQVC